MSLPPILQRTRIPVMASPLFIVSGPELVIAQCKAGVIGSFPALNAREKEGEPNMLDIWLTRINEELDRHNQANPDAPAAPYAVNQIVHKSNVRLERDVEMCVKHKVPVWITSLGARTEVYDAAHSVGGVVVHDVINNHFAHKAIMKGADGLVAVAAGAGGHAGAQSPLALIREIREWFDGPLLLSGAISKGDSILAAQAMGADMGYIGTAFIATDEANAVPGYKDMITRHGASDIVYTNTFSTLKPGRVRYGLMLREDGYIYDDGVVGRLAQDRFHVTTTTGGAPRVLNMMEDYLQTEFPHLKVWLTSTTEQWAVIAVQGPKAREIIAPFVEGVDISNEAFPHMSLAECTVCGVPARLFRVSFTGELGYEINVPADFGLAVWKAVFERAETFGACAYGTETMHVLRAEKGYIVVGQDTDGTVTPYDVGMGWAVSKKKPDFVGMRGLKRPDLVAEGRKQLVGLMVKNNPRLVLEEGAHVVADPNAAKPVPMLGHVTSAYWSEALQSGIAMAVVKDGHKLKGQTLYVPMPERTIAVEVVDTVFYDREGARING